MEDKKCAFLWRSVPSEEVFGSVLVYRFTRADTKAQTIHNSEPMTPKQRKNNPHSLVNRYTRTQPSFFCSNWIPHSPFLSFAWCFLQCRRTGGLGWRLSDLAWHNSEWASNPYGQIKNNFNGKQSSEPAGYWTADQENVGTRLCYFWWAKKQRANLTNSFMNGEIFWMNNKAIIEFGFRRIKRILQISEGVIIHLGFRPRWITPSLICRVLHILLSLI